MKIIANKILRRKPVYAATVVLLEVAAVALLGCSKHLDSGGDGGGDGQVPLKVVAMIEDGAGTKSPIDGSVFLGSDAGITYHIRMTLTNKAGEEYYLGSKQTDASLTVKNGATDTWSYLFKGALAPKSSLWMQAGVPITIAADYPYMDNPASVDPSFTYYNLTTPEEQANQTDKLYAKTQSVTATTDDVSKTINLNFMHVYTMLEFRIKKLNALDAKITQVDVCNAAGKSLISNTGKVSLSNGTISDQHFGTVTSKFDATTLTSDSYTTVKVMIPPFSVPTFTDGDVYIQLYDNGKAKTDKFQIKNSHLSTIATTNKGMISGMKYSFQLLYDNKLDGIGMLTLEDWSIAGTGGTAGDVAYIGWYSHSNGTVSQNTEKDYDGIVFWIDPTNHKKYKAHTTKGFSTSPWSAKATYVIGVNGRNIFDGRLNFTAINTYSKGHINDLVEDTKTIGNLAIDFNLAYVCNNYIYNDSDRGKWYVPSKNELQYIWSAYNGVTSISNVPEDVMPNIEKQAQWNARLKIIESGQELTNNIYWSSTEDGTDTKNAHIVDFRSGTSSNSLKTNSNLFRCIIERTMSLLPTEKPELDGDNITQGDIDGDHKDDITDWTEPLFPIYITENDIDSPVLFTSVDYDVKMKWSNFSILTNITDIVNGKENTRKMLALGATDDTNGSPAAHYCNNLMPVGTWYLPAINQLLLAVIYSGALSNNRILPNYSYLSSTERSESTSFCYPDYINKSTPVKVRCVSEELTTWKYPRIDADMSTIISKDNAGGIVAAALLTSAEQTWLKNTDITTTTYNESSQYNRVSPKLQVAKEDCSAINSLGVLMELNDGTKELGYSWSNAYLACKAYVEPNVTGSWRLPTQLELLLMYVMKSNYTFKDGFYWSGAVSSTLYPDQNRWIVRFPDGYTNGLYWKTDKLKVRCVRDGI